ncbi:MAG TPA: EF-Tu/IF-2/RF-3 family GTPase, partial [Desulfuromonadaceae bacterium]
GLLAPTLKEKYLGRSEIREVFSVPKVGNVAGCYVLDGKMLRNAQVRLLRDNVVVYEGKMASLRRFKDDQREVASGYECGIGLENYNDIKQGDIIEAFEIEKVATKL